MTFDTGLRSESCLGSPRYPKSRTFDRKVARYTSFTVNNCMSNCPAIYEETRGRRAERDSPKACAAICSSGS